MGWKVLYLKPRCEKKVAEYCAVHGFPHYLPLRTETKVYQRRKVTVQKPIFPGYFFVSVDEDQRVTLLKVNHIIRILEPNDERQLVHQLAQVRRALRVDPSLGACEVFSAGKQVRITGGPFAGIEGIVSARKTPSMVRLNIEMIGQAVSVDIAPEFIEPVDAA